MTLSRALFRVHKMDGRYGAYPHFTYYIEENLQKGWARGNQAKDLQDHNFFTLREWFWTAFGPSKELRYWKAHRDPTVTPARRSDNDHWCWETEFGRQRIYVDDKALALFNLKWI